MDAKLEQLEYMKVNELKRISRQLAEINKTLKHSTVTSIPPYQFTRSDQTDYAVNSDR